MGTEGASRGQKLSDRMFYGIVQMFFSCLKVNSLAT